MSFGVNQEIGLWQRLLISLASLQIEERLFPHLPISQISNIIEKKTIWINSKIDERLNSFSWNESLKNNLKTCLKIGLIAAIYLSSGYICFYSCLPVHSILTLGINRTIIPHLLSCSAEAISKSFLDSFFFALHRLIYQKLIEIPTKTVEKNDNIIVEVNSTKLRRSISLVNSTQDKLLSEANVLYLFLDDSSIARFALLLKTNSKEIASPKIQFELLFDQFLLASNLFFSNLLLTKPMFKNSFLLESIFNLIRNYIPLFLKISLEKAGQNSA